jgi:hypothetical protein
MGLFSRVVKMKQPLKEYGRFFNSNFANKKETTCFALEIEQTLHKYQVLPSQGSKEQQLFALDHQI